MKTFLGLIFCLVLVIAILLMKICQRKILKKTAQEFSDEPGSYTFAVEEFETNKYVTAVIVHPECSLQNFTEEELKPDNFTVNINSSTVTPEETYLCDINGDEAESESATHIALLLSNKTENALSWSEDMTAAIEHKKFRALCTKQNAPLFI